VLGGSISSESRAEQAPGASISTLTLHSRGEAPAERVETFQIWRARGRVREEQHGGQCHGYYGVPDGDLWWSWDERTGATSNEDDPSAGSGIGQQLLVMLDPTPLLGALRFPVVGRSEVAGRATILTEAGHRPSDPRRPPRAPEVGQLRHRWDLGRESIDDPAGQERAPGAKRAGRRERLGLGQEVP
jgi:hypothetical protein